MQKIITAKDPTAPARKALERQNKRKAGLVPVEVWIPADKKDELKAFVAHLQGLPAISQQG